MCSLDDTFDIIRTLADKLATQAGNKKSSTTSAVATILGLFKYLFDKVNRSEENSQDSYGTIIILSAYILFVVNAKMNEALKGG